MTVSFNPALTGALDKVRFEISDTNTTAAFIQDETITALLVQYNNDVLLTALNCARYIYGEISKLTPGRVGRFEVGSSPAEFYLKKIAILEKKVAATATPYAGGISIADKEARAENEDRPDATFTKTLHEPTTGIGSPRDPFLDRPVIREQR